MEDEFMSREEDDFTRATIITGAQALGTLAAAATASSVGGEGGIIAGSAGAILAANVLQRVGISVYDRIVHPQERSRIGRAWKHARQRIWERLAAGDIPRQDGFFSSHQNARPHSDELLEGVLLKAKDAYQEKKIAYISNIYANMIFEPIGIDEAILMLQLADGMTYRQFACLSLAGRATEFSLRSKEYEVGQRVTVATLGVIDEMLGLSLNALVQVKGIMFVALVAVAPAHLGLTGYGSVMVHLMELDAMPRDEIERMVARHLR